MNKLVSLKTLCHKVTDGSHYSPVGIDEGFPMLSVKDMNDYGFSYTDCKLISKKEYDKLVKADCKPRLNDLLIAKDGSYLKHVFVIKDEIDQAILSSIGILRPNLEKVYPDYLKYYLQTKSVKKEVAKKYVSGSALPRIILKGFEQIEIIEKDLPTQKSIAKVLSDLDAKIELNNKINRELEAMAKTLYDYWFVQFDFANEQGKPYKSSGGKMVYNEGLKREIPEGWEVGKATDLFDFNPTESVKKGEITSYVDMNALPTDGYMTKDVQHKVFNGGVKFKNGDVVVARITPCLENGKTGLITLLENDAVAFGSTEFIVMRGKNRSLSCFASYLSRSELFRKYAIANMTGTSGRKRVESKMLEIFRLPIPNDSLLDKFEKTIGGFFKKETVNTKENQQLTALRDWLLPMLMNGQVTVGEAEEKLNMAAEPQAEYKKG